MEKQFPMNRKCPKHSVFLQCDSPFYLLKEGSNERRKPVQVCHQLRQITGSCLPRVCHSAIGPDPCPRVVVYREREHSLCRGDRCRGLWGEFPSIVHQGRQFHGRRDRHDEELYSSAVPG